MNYSVKPMREAGLEAKWTKTRKMQEVGIVEAFERATLLGDIFSI